MIDRRAFLAAGLAVAGGCIAYSDASEAAPGGLRQIKNTLGSGARLGVAALDTATGRRLDLDPNSRYAMCSTFKAALAAAILAEVDRGARSLGDVLPVRKADLVEYAPAVTAALPEGRMTLDELCAAAVRLSDNAAANLLLKQIGGPAGFTAFVRRVGDPVTRLDRMETELNSNIRGDLRDTTTPAAMLGLMRTLLLGHALSPGSRARLAGWMESATTGRDRLRAGFPADWRAGEKTGTANGANNDVAIAWPPGRFPILIASYIDAPQATQTARNAAHVGVARLVSRTFVRS